MQNLVETVNKRVDTALFDKLRHDYAPRCAAFYLRPPQRNRPYCIIKRRPLQLPRRPFSGASARPCGGDARRLSRTVENQQERLLEQANRMVTLSQGMIESLAAAIEFRSEESGDHVRRIHDITVCLLAHTALGQGMSAETVHHIALASILHDVGKIAVPDAILNKPGRLTPEEFEIMKTHTVQGAALLDRIPQLHEHPAYRYARDIARHHHERWDGRGYPDGLKGGEISIPAQVVSIADVYDALSCKRVYKDAFPREQVLDMIRTGACGVFNPHLLECFFSVEEELSRLYQKGENANG